MSSKDATPVPEKVDLPEDLLSELEAAWFRNTGAKQRMLAVATIERRYPDQVSGIREFVARYPTVSSSDEAQPERVGPYRILALLGRGGFGEVYRAVEVGGLPREVAVKVLKLGMDTRSILRRFSRERDALARMNHDAIARVFDAGTTDLGKPWFSMELVEGLPIVEFCKQHRLSRRSRLALFCAVCHGVHHAHQKGVLHRDIKPSNVLVCGGAKDPRPKLIDFGIACAMEQSDDSAGLTETGMMLGTPRYMSPEQLRGDFEAIDTRADVFSLGAVLYEMLTGKGPHAVALAGTRGAQDVRERIRDLDIGKPSAATVLEGAQERTWQRALRGDLDWIVQKATERDPELRYASAAELAADVERHLADDEVSARPPSMAYSMRKYVRRHRLQVVAAVVVMMTAFVGVGVSLRYAMLASEQAEEAGAQRRDVLRLAARQDLDVLLREEASLWPPYQDRIPDLARWTDSAQRLVDELPGHYAQLAALALQARPSTEAERAADRASHPSAERLAKVEAELASLERALATRAMQLGGREVVVSATMEPTSEQPLPSSRRARFDLARSWSWPERTEFGRERKGRDALRALLKDSQPPISHSVLHEALAWAEFACGDDAAATREMALAETKAAAAPGIVAIDGTRLRQAIARAQSDAGITEAGNAIGALRAERARLDAEVDVRRTWNFAPDDRASAWWSAQLEALIRDLERLRVVHLDASAGADPATGWGVARRLRFARTMQASFAEGGGAFLAWAAAAPELTRAYPELKLLPQPGLMPLGADPQSGLWEFACLCSGVAPVRDGSGKLVLGSESAIVFVLVPGGSFRMGASRDRDSVAFDPEARLVEEPPHEVRVSPYFLAKHEVTQPQWQRLMGTQPSAYTLRLHWIASELHPVEQVSWFDADRFCRRAGLSLPTEAQWERAARGGTTARWSIADQQADLVGKFNIADRSAAKHGATWPSIADWPTYDDGWNATCPIGALPPNPFGFHEMLGNLWEWCLDGHYTHAYETHAEVDPFQPAEGLPQRTSRGGSFDNTIATVRVTSRDGAAPQVSGHTIGFRPARRVE